MTDTNATEYLKGAVGDLLAKGVAQTVETKPSDPVEYLALWLLHEQQRLNIVEPKRAEARELLEKDREEFKKQQEEEAAEAARIIQAQMKIALAHRAKAEEAEKKLLKEYDAEKESFEEDFDDEYEENEEGGEGAQGDGEEGAEGGENDERKNEAIKNLEMEKARIQMINGYLKKIDSNQFKGFRIFKKPVPEKGSIHYNIAKAILLINDVKYKNLKSWNDIKLALPKSGEDIRALLTNYNAGKPSTKPVKFKRAKRFLRYLNEEEVKKRGLLTYLLMDWIDACMKANTAINAAKPFLPPQEEEEAEEEEEDDDPYGATPSEAEWVDPDIAVEQEGEGEGGEEQGEGDDAEEDDE